MRPMLSDYSYDDDNNDALSAEPVLLRLLLSATSRLKIVDHQLGGHNLRYEIINRIYMYNIINIRMYVCIISYACGERQCGTTMT